LGFEGGATAQEGGFMGPKTRLNLQRKIFIRKCYVGPNWTGSTTTEPPIKKIHGIKKIK
jgi:hypothetical protein